MNLSTSPTLPLAGVHSICFTRLLAASDKRPSINHQVVSAENQRISFNSSCFQYYYLQSKAIAINFKNADGSLDGQELQIDE